MIKEARHLAMWCGATVTLGTVTCAGAQDWVRFTEDGRQIAVEAVGISRFAAVSSVVFDAGDQTQRVGSQGDKMIGPVRHSEGTTPFGDAVVSEATFGREGSPFQYTLTLKRLKNLRAFTLQGVFHNRSDKDSRLHGFDLLDTRKGPGGSFEVPNSDDWLVTPLMEDSPAVSLTVAEKRLKEAALVYQKNGSGFLVGPVGPAEAYTSFQAVEKSIIASVEMDKVLVRAGESRRSEEMIFAFEPIDTATSIWTRWVAATHGARMNKGPVYGWCSWYDRTTKIDEAHVMDVTKTIAENPNVFGKGIIQIDDGYQKMDGDWSGNEKFPSGMAAVAKRIRAAGCTPGVWFAPLMMSPDHPWQKEHPDAMQTNAQGIASFMNANPFHPAGANWINPSHPESKKFLAKIIKDARDRGFGYIKIDFNGIGNKFVDPTKTRMQAFRELYAVYREAAGEEMYILSCLGSPTRGVVGFIDSARVGPDSHPAGLAHCLDSVLRFQIYDKVWWHNDADVSYLAPKLESRRVGFTPQGEGMWRSWHNIVALTGGTAMISEPIDKDDVKAVWRNYEIMRPGSAEPAQLLTLGKTGDNSTFGFSATRPYGNFAVYNLYNALEKKRHINLNFIHTGLPTDQDCAVFDFWQNKVIATTKGSYNTIPLDQYSSALLRFTPLPTDGRPTLVGSNLHLSMGATEINNIRVSSSVVTLELGDAGAQDGALTFFSKRPLTAKASENCSVTSVKNLGGYIWQVNVSGRKWNTAQSIELQVSKHQSTSPSVTQ
jgi:alpha-galactosidase